MADIIKDMCEYNLADFISDFVFDYDGIDIQWTEDNNSYKCCCPFHNEKTPSFCVNQKENGDWLWYCQGECKTGGNIINFVQRYTELDSKESLKIISDYTGIEIDLKPVDPLYKEYIDIMNSHNKRYTKELNDAMTDYKEHEAHDVRVEFLHDRFLDDDIIKAFNIGLAPYDERDTGLRLRDINSRIVIPLDEMAPRSTNVVGFCYRTIEDVLDPTAWHVKKKSGIGKYIMSPNSENGIWGRHIFVENKNGKDKYKSKYKDFYVKNNYLYNYSRAYEHIRKSNEVIIVEGAIDVISLYKSNIKNVVSTLTCAISDEIIELLAGKAKNIVIWYDNDEAGHKNIPSISSKFTNFGCNVYVYSQEYQADPDDICKKVQFKEEAIRNLINKNKKDAYDFMVDKYLNSGILSRIKNIKRAAMADIKVLLDPLPDDIKKERLEEVRRLLEVT